MPQWMVEGASHPGAVRNRVRANVPRRVAGGAASDDASEGRAAMEVSWIGLYRAVMSISGQQKRAFWILVDAGVAAAAFTAAAIPLLPLTPATQVALALLVGIIGGILSETAGLSVTRIHGYGRAMRRRQIGIGVGLAAIMALATLAVGVPAGAAGLTGLCGGALAAALGVASRTIAGRALTRLYAVGDNRRRTIIWGAGAAGRELLSVLRDQRVFDVVGFIDDDPLLHGATVDNLVVRPPNRLDGLVRQKGVSEVHLAMPGLGAVRRAQIVSRLRDLGVETLELAPLAHLLRREDMTRHLNAVSVTELLGRQSLESDLPGASDAYAGRVVLISGAGGSIGSELCRQVLTCGPSCVVLLEVSEYALYRIDRELRTLAKAIEREGGYRPKIVPVLGSVCDPRKMRDVIARENVRVVLHAAAYKHVPLVESNPIAGLSNNVVGTRVLARAAAEAGIERFVLVSSDKAVRPTGVMGATKRMAEMVVQDLAARAGRGEFPGAPIFTMVRFGNVLGSSGSVVPLFREQIAAGGPVTITDRGMKRYFMSIPEAAKLVLVSGSLASGGEVYVLEMGSPQRIEDLARGMIRRAGLTIRDKANPEGDIEIAWTGMRPGEKMEEELFYNVEEMIPTGHQKVLLAAESHPSQIALSRAMAELDVALGEGDARRACRIASELLGVPIAGAGPVAVPPAAPPGVAARRAPARPAVTGAAT